MIARFLDGPLAGHSCSIDCEYDIMEQVIPSPQEPNGFRVLRYQLIGIESNHRVYLLVRDYDRWELTTRDLKFLYSLKISPE